MPRAGYKRSQLVFVFLIGILILIPVATHAAVSINEIMYDLPGTDTSREWVELFNPGPEPVIIVTGSGFVFG